MSEYTIIKIILGDNNKLIIIIRYLLGKQTPKIHMSILKMKNQNIFYENLALN